MAISTMPAFQLIGLGCRELREVPIPDVCPGQVLLRVALAGICGTDLELTGHPQRFHGDMSRLPLTLGHEFSGWVEKVGDGTPWTPGELVVPYGMRGCGSCRSCRHGEENLCIPRPPVLGIGRDGGLAEFVLVDSDDLVSAEGVPPRLAAGMTDAGMTAYHASDRVSRYLRDQRIAVVIGIGGIGHLTLQFLNALCDASVVAIDVDPRKLEFAERLGAWQTACFGEAREALAPLADGGQLDAVIDNVGTTESLELARDLVRPGGVVRLVGTANGQLSFRFFDVPRGTSFLRSSGGTRDDLRAALDIARNGKIALSSVELPFDEVRGAFASLESGSLLGRAMVRMS